MVPRFCASSALVMPMPGSEIVSVRAVFSGVIVTFASAGGAETDCVSASKRRRSRASAALATSSVGRFHGRRVKGMDHEVQQPADLGTEFVPFQGIAQGFASGDRTVRDMIPTTGKFNACNRVRAKRMPREANRCADSERREKPAGRAIDGSAAPQGCNHVGFQA